MPFEIGLDFGCRRYGNINQQTKDILILAEEPYHYQKAMSDLSGIDVQVHNGKEEEIVRCVRNWFYTKKTSIEQATTIWDDYNAFVAHLYADFQEKDVLGMPIPEFIDKARNYISSI